MTSVASKRLFTEYKTISQDPPEGITAGPVNEDDMFTWEALVQGPEGTPFEGGIFPAELKFPRDYPLAPPTMRFTCDIWHPNGKSVSTWSCDICIEQVVDTAINSLPKRHGLHIHPACSWRRSKPLRTRVRTMVPHTKR